MVLLRLVLMLLLAGGAGLFAAGQLGWLRGNTPTDLGVREGRLKPPSRTENSVSSQASLHAGAPAAGGAGIAPLAAKGTPAGTLQRLRKVVETLAGAQVIEARDDYLYVQFTTRWLKFVDDAEFWFDPAAGVVQVRSASRIGRKDFGVNRARIEVIRRLLEKA
jgi:uncharacterized protein (DUF1499 family)